MNSNQSSGFGDVNGSILKQVRGTIKDPLMHNFNFSFHSDLFLDKLKIARVSPIFKTGGRDQLTMQGPIH